MQNRTNMNCTPKTCCSSLMLLVLTSVQIDRRVQKPVGANHHVCICNIACLPKERFRRALNRVALLRPW